VLLEDGRTLNDYSVILDGTIFSAALERVLSSGMPTAGSMFGEEGNEYTLNIMLIITPNFVVVLSSSCHILLDSL
jgi:hypothetical protein